MESAAEDYINQLKGFFGDHPQIIHNQNAEDYENMPLLLRKITLNQPISFSEMTQTQIDAIQHYFLRLLV